MLAVALTAVSLAGVAVSGPLAAFALIAVSGWTAWRRGRMAARVAAFAGFLLFAVLLAEPSGVGGSPVQVRLMLLVLGGGLLAAEVVRPG